VFTKLCAPVGRGGRECQVVKTQLCMSWLLVVKKQELRKADE
jgi:hypothetical protein